MNALIRIVCLGLALALVAPALAAQAEDAKKKTEQSTSKSKSKSTSKDSSSKKSKGKGKDKAASKSAAGQEPEGQGGGFRNLSWGAPLSVLHEPEMREEVGELKYYVVPGDDPDVLGIPMREIVYVFCKGKLAGVLARYDGQINHLLLLGKLKDAHGAPLETQPNLQGDRSWRFDAGHTSIMMEYSDKGFTGALAWMARDRLSLCQPGE